jgi:uncharacterized protein YgiM (DUF1202 family)
MKFSTRIATASMALSMFASGAFAQSSAPVSSAATPAAAATAMPAAAPAANTAVKVKSIKRRYLLTHSSSFYSQPDKGSTVIAHVKRRNHVNVTGVTGDWLQIHLSSGKEGYIPASAAE